MTIPAGHRFEATQAIYGVGPILACHLLAELGEAARFRRARQRSALPAWIRSSTSQARRDGAAGWPSTAHRCFAGRSSKLLSTTQAPVELVGVTLGSLNYLFRIAHEGPVAVFGTSSRATGPRPKARMRGYPSYNREPRQRVDRGHVVAHSVGGGVDINLVPQFHGLNVSSEWRAFERYAQQTSGQFFSFS
jgi:hypothetical protein